MKQISGRDYDRIHVQFLREPLVNGNICTKEPCYPNCIKRKEHLKAIRSGEELKLLDFQPLNGRAGPPGAGGWWECWDGERPSKVNLSGVPFQQLVSHRTPPTITPSRHWAAEFEVRERPKESERASRCGGPLPPVFFFTFSSKKKASSSALPFLPKGRDKYKHPCEVRGLWNRARRGLQGTVASWLLSSPLFCTAKNGLLSLK